MITIVERLVKRKMTLYIEKLATGDDLARPRSSLVLLLSCRSPSKRTRVKELNVSSIYWDYTCSSQRQSRARLVTKVGLTALRWTIHADGVVDD